MQALHRTAGCAVADNCSSTDHRPDCGAGHVSNPLLQRFSTVRAAFMRNIGYRVETKREERLLDSPSSLYSFFFFICLAKDFSKPAEACSARLPHVARSGFMDYNDILSCRARKLCNGCNLDGSEIGIWFFI